MYKLHLYVMLHSAKFETYVHKFSLNKLVLQKKKLKLAESLLCWYFSAIQQKQQTSSQKNINKIFHQVQNIISCKVC